MLNRTEHGQVVHLHPAPYQPEILSRRDAMNTFEGILRCLSAKQKAALETEIRNIRNILCSR